MSKAKVPARGGERVDDPLFDRIEAAQYMGVTARWIKDRLADGTIPHIKLNRLVRFRRSQLDAYLASHTVTPEDWS